MTQTEDRLRKAKNQMQEIVLRALEQSNGYLAAEKEYLRKTVFARNSLIHVVAHEAFDLWALRVLYKARQKLKNELLDHPHAESDQVPPRTRRDFAVMRDAANILDLFRCGGKPIGDCTQGELSAAADYHATRGNAEYRRAAVYRAVAAKIKADERVRDRLSAAEVERIISNVNRMAKVS